MRHTAKLKAALRLAARLKLSEVDDAAEIYRILASRSYAWDADARQWHQTTRQVDDTGRERTSIFGDEDVASGLVRVRLMAHPAEMDRFTEIMMEALDTYGLRITDVSNPDPNRKGVGVRVYMTCHLPPP